ncbi:hypothetical protein PR202_gb08489 [Eleusine coracana subsp. coracana]|uniref:DUF4283 domain-containing protein n=1 Tax=Eleusine coracana subsp. coracana TaxID=191504 RepID=A0AAV5ECA2_ELECO|nr:hypothetical protein QOZ80_2BG0185820 [Eleusine coracana subsp. coracana]GJN21043.1 hypothetical protein PR202_gb08489 [Eleusine coracana subsp. coracana]
MAAAGSRPVQGDAMGDEAHVADLLGRLNLTQEEEFAAFSDDDDVERSDEIEFGLIGKVLSPSTLHISTIMNAMKPAWGNPHGLKLRSVGERHESLFIAEFGCLIDKMKALNGSPWMVGKHAVILREYDETLKPSDVNFANMDLWVRILNLSFGWMNDKRGPRVAGLIGEMVKIDVDAHGKASGPYLRARVSVEVEKPLRRGVMLKTDPRGKPEWYEIQYEKLSFYCYSCGIMGHTEIE